MTFLNFLYDQWSIALIVNFLLIFLAQSRIPLLTKSGWLHAGILGTLIWGCLGWTGWFSVVFYLFLGSLVTKLGFAQKAKQGIAEPRGGRRGPENVWGSAATGAFLALLIEIGFGSEKLLLIGFSASFAAKLADTFGSEIGKRWGGKTILITTLKIVSPGTDGAISLQGSFASVLGSVLMSLCMYYLHIIHNFKGFLLVAFVGFIATLIESLIGATFQKRFSWLSNELVNFLQTSLASAMAILSGFYIL